MGIHQPPPHETPKGPPIGIPSFVTAGSLKGPLHGWGSVTMMKRQSRLMEGDVGAFAQLSTKLVNYFWHLCVSIVND